MLQIVEAEPENNTCLAAKSNLIGFENPMGVWGIPSAIHPACCSCLLSVGTNLIFLQLSSLYNTPQAMQLPPPLASPPFSKDGK